jgi:hypothetical protein
VLVTRPNPGDIIRLRDRAVAVSAAANARGRRGVTPAVVLIADQRTLRATAAEVGQALGQGNVPAGVVGGIADDDKGAELLRGEWGGRLDKTLLIRTARETAQQLAASLPAARDDARPQQAPPPPAPPRSAQPQQAQPQQAQPQQAQPPQAPPQQAPSQQYPPAPSQYPPGAQYPSPPAGQQQYPAPPQYPQPPQQPPVMPPPAVPHPPAPQQYPPGQRQRGGGGRHSASAQPAAAGHEAGEGQWTTA